MANVNGREIDLLPTKGMKEEAQRYRDWKADGKAGGTEVAARRATQILSGDELSPETVIAMSAWHARHSVDAEAEGYKAGEEGFPSPGRVAAAAWGGPPGKTWSDAKAKAIKNAQERSMKRAEPGSLSRGDMVSWNSSGGRARGKITRIETDGTIDIPDSSFTVTGTEDDPAALIQVYRDDEPTDRYVGHKFSTLTKERSANPAHKIEPVLNERMGDLLLHRGQFVPSSANTEDRTVEVTWTTGAPVLRRGAGGSYYEELALGEAVNMERLNSGAPLLNSHRASSLSDVVGVVERAWFENEEGRALVRFSDREDVEPIWRDVSQGIVRNISVGYTVEKYERIDSRKEGEPHTLRATSWSPHELSLVPIPADHAAQVRDMEMLGELNTDKEPIQMDETREMDAAPVEVASAPAPVDNTQAIRAAVEADRQRAQEIRSCFRAAGLDGAKAEELVNAGTSIEEARKQAIDALAAQQAAAPTIQHVAVTEDASDKRQACLEAALEARLGHREWDDAASAERSMSLMDLARHQCERRGLNLTGMSKSEIAYRAMHSTSDFPLLLSNIARKSLMAGYDAEEQTWRPLARQRNLPDFKSSTELMVAGQLIPEEIAEGGEYKAATIKEADTSWNLKTYAKKIKVTRQLIINDDLDALGRIPGMIGRGMSLLESNVMWNLLTSNPTMGEDGVALFHADHDNQGTGAIGETALSDARQALRTQSDLAGNRVNLRPRYLVVPTALETAAQKQLTSVVANTTGDVNIFAGSLGIIVEPRLDDASSTVYYVTADPAQVNMLVYGYLEGEAGPQVYTEDERDPDGTCIYARLDFGASVLDHRGFYKSTGV